LASGTGFAPAFAGFPCRAGAATTFPGTFAFVSRFFDSGIFVSGFFRSTFLGSGGLG
jgi:small basic protein